MSNKIAIVFFCLVTALGFTQEDAWVYFKDKPNAQFYLNNPLEILSQRAIDRRNIQNLSLDVTDAPISTDYINQIENANGIIVMAKSKWLNALHIRGQISDINDLINLSFVDKITFANHALNAQQVSFNKTNSTSRLQNKLEVQITYNYGNSANQIEMLNGHLLHQQDYTGQGKVIAVLDAGFPGVDSATPFKRLRDNNLILGGYNFPDRNTNFYTRHSHGTNVLSTMGGFVEGQLVGTAPDAQYYLFITEDANSENPVEESYWVEALEMADSLGVDVVNSSLGYGTYDNANYTYLYSHRNGQVGFASRAAAMAMQKGIICVVSAGNSGGSSEPHISIPSDAANILTIGAVDSNENRASFSSIGNSFDGRVKPDLVAKGVSATVSSQTGAIGVSNGTSFSSPILAGMVATFWSAVPDLTAHEVMDFVKKSADQYNAPDIYKGYGVPDFSLALQNVIGEFNLSENKVIVYPNPVSSFLFLEAFDQKILNIEIFNILGNRVGNYSENKSKIDVNHFSTGIYFYEIQTNKEIIKGKFIKN